MYESTLGPDARARLREIGWVDLVIGVPSHRNGRTIGEVAQAIAGGISTYLTHYRVLLMNADGGSSDNTTRHIADLPVPPNVEKLVTVYEGPMGKGTGIRAIFEAAAELGAKAVVIIEARAPGIRPEWIPALVNPILAGYELATGCYQRSAYAAALSDNLVYPFMRTFLNADLREPVPSEFAISGSLAAELAGRDVWETDVSRFGINVWLTIQALVENRRIAQVDLGYRGEGSGEPGTLLDARLMQTIGTLFRLLTVHQRLWQKNPPIRQIPFHSGRCPDAATPCTDCVQELVAAFKEGWKHYRHEWGNILLPETQKAIAQLVDSPAEAFAFPCDLWAQAVMEFAVVYNKGEGDPDKVVEAFLPLFYGRAAAYVRQTLGLTVAQREHFVQEVLQAFYNAKNFILEQWHNYEAWLDTNNYWFI